MRRAYCLIFFLVLLYISPAASDNSEYQNFAANVLNFVRKEYDVNELPIVSFERHEKSIRRMAYHCLSTSAQTADSLMLSVHMMNTLGDYNTSLQDGDSKTVLYSHVLVVTSFNNSENWEKYLELMTKTKVKSSIIMFVGKFDEQKWEHFISKADSLSKNALFYAVFQKDPDESNNTMIWYRIMTINGYNQSVVNQMKFDSNGRLTERYNMQGFHITSITLSWSPYFSLINCSDEGRDCESEGYLTDVMNILGNMMNFTWESHGEINGNWGTTVISGPSNSSGIWGGVVGNVFNGTYQLSIR